MEIHLPQPPRRVVSLVPSLTESLFDLGLGERLVAVTDFCVHPAEGVKRLPRIGGTKNPRLDEIVALAPDLVLANQEENRQRDVEQLRAAGLNVWATFPRTVRDALRWLWEIVRLFDVPEMSGRLATIEHTLDWTRAAANAGEPMSVFSPVWRYPASDKGSAEWWMTVNAETYMSDILAACGGRNVFAERERRFAGEDDNGFEQAAKEAGRDRRYPRVTSEEIVAAQPEVILLPSEPYSFGEADRDEVFCTLDVPAVRNGRVFLVDGSLLTWHGTRIARALQEVPPLLARTGYTARGHKLRFSPS